MMNQGDKQEKRSAKLEQLLLESKHKTLNEKFIFPYYRKYMLVIIENLQNVEKEKEKPSSCLVHYFLLLFPSHLGSFGLPCSCHTHFFLFKFIILTFFYYTSCNIFNGHKIFYQVAMSQFNRQILRFLLIAYKVLQ